MDAICHGSKNEERKHFVGSPAQVQPSRQRAKCFGEFTLTQKPYSRRALSRLRATDDVWVCWRCNDRDDVSRVVDISVDGLFIETAHLSVKDGMTAKLDFLVQEGSIRAEAVVRHINRETGGLGMRIVAVGEDDRKRLKALLTRLRARAGHPMSHPFGQFELL